MSLFDQPHGHAPKAPGQVPRQSSRDIQADFDAWDSELEAELSAGAVSDRTALQMDLSALADGELDEAAAARVMVQLQADEGCRSFFDDVQRFARLHRDMDEPDRVVARLTALTGTGLPGIGDLESAIGGAAGSFEQRVEEIDLVHRLATIFYSLGKAYVLAALDPASFRERVFEAAAPINVTRTTGRGFVDGVLKGGRSEGHRVDWNDARRSLNGRLERLEDPMVKGLHLLEQALATDPSHEEARIYLAFVYAQQGKTLKAADQYREVFDTAIRMENRGHAAIQLGQLHTAEEEHRRAATFYRWVRTTGLETSEPRFWFVNYNIAMAYLGMGQQERCLDYLAGLAETYPNRVNEAASLVVDASLFKDAIQSQPGFAERFAERCPAYLTSQGQA